MKPSASMDFFASRAAKRPWSGHSTARILVQFAHHWTAVGGVTGMSSVGRRNEQNFPNIPLANIPSASNPVKVTEIVKRSMPDGLDSGASRGGRKRIKRPARAQEFATRHAARTRRSLLRNGQFEGERGETGGYGFNGGRVSCEP